MKTIVTVTDVHKKFKLGEHEIYALRGVDLEVTSGHFLAIAGASGSGKTTLLNLIGCLDLPHQGQILHGDVNIRDLSDLELSKLRAERIGFIFQTFNLLPVLTAIENVQYPLQLVGTNPAEVRSRARAALERVGLAEFLDHRPDQLSGGQRQRVAIARALVKRPTLILADEPTANLDAKTAVSILDLMSELNEKDGATFVLSSHDPNVLARAQKVVRLADGRLAV